ncbi:MAG: hypothetical protein RBT78_00310 [Kiritimatiellia bacterium]|jgi:hypothetical protein|nr:hypothetical protein [Kiritimatiellia bacterium]
MRETAETYHRQRRGNCAQAVAHAWENKVGDPGKTAGRFAGCGGGRAPGGLCGALYASCTLAGTAAADAIKTAFAERSGGHHTCRAVRATHSLTCNECVGLAAALLEERLRPEGGHGG